MTEIQNISQTRVVLKNQIGIDLSLYNAFIGSYLELEDRILLRLVWSEKLKPQYDIHRNILCYAKATGALLWQVEQPWQRERVDPEGKTMRKVYVEEVYKYIKILIQMPDGTHDSNQHVSKSHAEGSVNGKIYLKPLRPNLDRLEAMTFSHFPKEYAIDPDTGEVELLEMHQPSEKLY